MKLLIINLIPILIIFSSHDANARRGLQGCCSHHGGVSYCDHTTGYVICNDGTISPTCRCETTNDYESAKPSSNSNSYYSKPSYTPPKSNSYSTYSNTTYAKNDKSSEKKKLSFFQLRLAGGIEYYEFMEFSKPHENALSELQVNVEPIYLAYVRGDISIPLLFFKGVFKYNIMENGGCVGDENRDELINHIYDDNKIQYLLRCAAGIIGIEFSYTVEHFNYGTVQYFIAENEYSKERNLFSGQNKFQLKKTQMDLRYHQYWYRIPGYGGVTRDRSNWDFYYGFRYVDYDKPGIVYTYNDMYDGPCGESKPQMINYETMLFGIGFNNNEKELYKGLNGFFGMEFYFGGGITRLDLNDYYFNENYFDDEYNPSDYLNREMYSLMFKFAGNIGFSYVIRNSFIAATIKIEYFYDFSFVEFREDLFEQGEYNYSTGYEADNFDLFHSVMISAEIKI